MIQLIFSTFSLLDKFQEKIITILSWIPPYRNPHPERCMWIFYQGLGAGDVELTPNPGRNYITTVQTMHLYGYGPMLHYGYILAWPSGQE